MTQTASRGRPRASSRAVLEEAAYELFLELGYDGTSVARIAQRAGVSRGTFFNYFSGKADVFWGDVDAALEALGDVLRATLESDTCAAVREGLRELAAGFGPDRVPWILTHFDTVGRPAEVGASALARMARAADIIAQFAAERSGVSARDIEARTTAYTALATLVAAAQSWAESGPGRGSLAPHLTRAFASTDSGPAAR